MELQPDLFSPPPPGARGISTEPSVGDGGTPNLSQSDRAPFLPWSQGPGLSLTDSKQPGDERMQAKRARVETIVRAMSLPTDARAPGSCLRPDKTGLRPRKQRCPMQQGLQPGVLPGQRGARLRGARVREQLHQLKQQLRHLQERVQGADSAGALSSGQAAVPESWAKDSGPHRASSRDLGGAQGAGEASLPSRGTPSLLRALKAELVPALAQAVDSALHKVLLGPARTPPQLDRSLGALELGGRSRGSAPQDPFPLTQPQSGSLGGHPPLTKPLNPAACAVSPRMLTGRWDGPSTSSPATVPPRPPGQQSTSYSCWRPGLCPSACARAAHRSWGSVRLRPSVLSRVPSGMQSLLLPPPVKREQGGLRGVPEDTAPFQPVHEGLNPGHLKKAKQMFFFTRYPSSNLLKVYFPDVQFNRGITSQMIKWFSNFREFYYIQMEKSARHAISEGVTNPKELVVLRDSELFRALNTHYNKGNELEVPDCFLEIASLTLQEFFRAVSSGKDSDPSWKKPIYKIISKLDSDIPEIFKSPSYPQALFHS